MEIIDDRKMLAIELLADGELTKVDIAKKVGIARQTIYDWMNDDKFKAELDNRLHQRKVFVQKKIDGKLDFVIDKLYELANDDSNKRVQAQVLQYLADRSLGKTTTKLELESSINTNTVDDDILDVEYDALEEPEEN